MERKGFPHTSYIPFCKTSLPGNFTVFFNRSGRNECVTNTTLSVHFVALFADTFRTLRLIGNIYQQVL